MQARSALQEYEVLQLGDSAGLDSELARCIPHLGRMSEQLAQTSAQIEESIVEVCASFQGIAERARRNAHGVTGMLGQGDGSAAGERSFEGLLQACANTMVKLLDAAGESGRIAGRAIERIQGIDITARQITGALGRLEMIASGNKILALNARIEAAHIGDARRGLWSCGGRAFAADGPLAGGDGAAGRVGGRPSCARQLDRRRPAAHAVGGRSAIPQVPGGSG